MRMANTYQVDSIHDASQEQLQVIRQSRSYPDPQVLTELRKRKLISMQKVISYEFEKGPKFAAEFVKEETDLTADMLARSFSMIQGLREGHTDDILSAVLGNTSS